MIFIPVFSLLPLCYGSEGSEVLKLYSYVQLHFVLKQSWLAFGMYIILEILRLNILCLILKLTENVTK